LNKHRKESKVGILLEKALSRFVPVNYHG